MSFPLLSNLMHIYAPVFISDDNGRAQLTLDFHLAGDNLVGQ